MGVSRRSGHRRRLNAGWRSSPPKRRATTSGPDTRIAPDSGTTRQPGDFLGTGTKRSWHRYQEQATPSREGGRPELRASWLLLGLPDADVTRFRHDEQADDKTHGR